MSCRTGGVLRRFHSWFELVAVATGVFLAAMSQPAAHPRCLWCPRAVW
jgi:hypothetical protein